MVKERDHRLQLEKYERNATAVLATNKNTDDLNVGKLDALLAWHQVEKTKGAKKADKLNQWKAIVADEKQPPPFSKWTNTDDEILENLRKKEIDIGDTAYGRMLALKEREFESAICNMTKEKRDEMRRKIDEMDLVESVEMGEVESSSMLEEDKNEPVAI